MVKSTVYKRGPATAGLNMTAMIDVTFQLIIFFILAGSFASLDAVPLDVPAVYDPAALGDSKLPYKAVVNLLPHAPDAVAADAALAGQAAAWQVSTARIAPGEVGRLLEVLRSARQAFQKRRAAGDAPAEQEFQVELRADKSLDYGEVAPVLATIGQAGFARVHYVAYSTMEDD